MNIKLNNYHICLKMNFFYIGFNYQPLIDAVEIPIYLLAYSERLDSLFPMARIDCCTLLVLAIFSRQAMDHLICSTRSRKLVLSIL